MEKILRNTVLRRNQLVRKARKEDLKELRAEWREYGLNKTAQQQTIHKLLVEERKNRREDWICGPLAPKRDVGLNKGKYGTLPSVMQVGPKLPSRYTRPPKGKGEDFRGSEDTSVYKDGEWRATGILGNVVVGDRVAVVRGRPGVKGKIGEVYRVENDHQQVFIRDVNKVDMSVPSFLGEIKEKFSATEIGINMSDIRLVIRLEDREAGTDRDYIVREVRGDAPFLQREPNSNIPRHTRYAVAAGPSGEDFEIAWPPAQEAREYNQDDDTPTPAVEDITYLPSLLTEGSYLPDGAIDELRSKYSRTRKSHDDTEWLRRKVLEDMRASWTQKQMMAGMVKTAKSHEDESRLAAERKKKMKRPEWQQTKPLIRQVQATKM